MKLKFILIFICLSSINVIGQDSSFHPTQKTLLNKNKGKDMLRQCSRQMPRDVKNFWDLQETDVIELENVFKKVGNIELLKTTPYNTIIDNLNSYKYQYIGFIINKKKYIYLNALKPPSNWFADWETESVRACDGFINYWGVLFDIETKNFTDFQSNGRR